MWCNQELYNTHTVELKIRAKLIVNSNHPLIFSDNDGAIRRRTLFFKFHRVFSEHTNVIGTKTSDGRVIEKAAPARALTAREKTVVFLTFALHHDGDEHPAIPTDILTRDQLFDMEHFIKTNFALKDDAYVSKTFLFAKLHETYPDFKLSAAQIFAEVKKLPANWNVTYEKSQRDGVTRGKFAGLHSKEEKNVSKVRDLDYERRLMNKASCFDVYAHPVKSFFDSDSEREMEVDAVDEVVAVVESVSLEDEDKPPKKKAKKVDKSMVVAKKENFVKKQKAVERRAESDDESDGGSEQGDESDVTSSD
jgi:hypothetical protein